MGSDGPPPDGHKPPAGILRRAACAYYSGHQITGTPWSSSSAARSSRFKNVVAVFSSGWTPTVRPPQRRIQHHGDRAGRRPEGPQRRHLSRQQAQKPLQVCGVRKSQRTAVQCPAQGLQVCRPAAVYGHQIVPPLLVVPQEEVFQDPLLPRQTECVELLHAPYRRVRRLLIGDIPRPQQGIQVLAVYPHTPAKRNTTPTTAEAAMNTMGWRFFVVFTQLVSASSTAARIRPGQLMRPARPPSPAGTG